MSLTFVQLYCIVLTACDYNCILLLSSCKLLLHRHTHTIVSAIEFLNMLQIVSRESTSLSEVSRADRGGFWCNGGPVIPGKRIGTVVHDGCVVVWQVLCTGISCIQLCEVRSSPCDEEMKLVTFGHSLD